MRNIINEKPTDKLSGRTLYSTKFVDKIDLTNKDILDLGCGFGWFELHALKQRCKKIAGVELSNKDLATAENGVKNKRAIFRIGSAIDIPFKDESFDTVVCWEVIEHIPKGTESKMFSEIYRVLRPGGKVYLSTPNQSFISNIFDPAWWLIGHRHYSKNKISDLATKNGFKKEKIESMGGIWDIISINNLYISKWIFRRKPLFHEKIALMQDKAYLKEGFTTIFLKLQKI